MWYEDVLVQCLALTAVFVCVSTHRKTVIVKKGRTVFVERSDLAIQVPSGEVCKVEVVNTDPMSQRVGRLQPQVCALFFFYLHGLTAKLDNLMHIWYIVCDSLLLCCCFE